MTTKTVLKSDQTCNLIVNQIENYDEYKLMFKTNDDVFTVTVDGLGNRDGEWDKFIEDLEHKRDSKLFQRNLILQSTVNGKMDIYVSNDLDNIVFSTKVSSSIVVEPFKLMMAMAKAYLKKFSDEMKFRGETNDSRPSSSSVDDFGSVDEDGFYGMESGYNGK